MKQAPVAILLAFVAVTVQLVSGVQDLEQKYSYATDLQAGYRVHWNVDLVEQKIEFALNVSTKGWIGFGISPTGKMLESDIVIGWVNKDGSAQFHDHFASISHILPPIDAKQNWFLTGSSQKDGYTVLEFYRDLTTCDEQDVPIKAGATQVIYAFHSKGPDSMTTLDSLTPEAIGSIDVTFIPGNKKYQKQKLEL